MTGLWSQLWRVRDPRLDLGASLRRMRREKARADGLAVAEPAGDYPRPRSSRWTCVSEFPPGAPEPEGAIYLHESGLTAISTRVNAEYPDRTGVGPPGPRLVLLRGPAATDRAPGRARAFGMVGTEEGNHHPGVARHFWRPVDPARRVDCECKADEVTVVEPDGYRWTNPADGPCRGCELERATGRPCSLHRGAP